MGTPNAKLAKFGASNFEYGVLDENDKITETRKINGLSEVKVELTNDLKTLAADDGPYLEIEMYSDPKKPPTDEQNTKHIKLMAEFAARFWGEGLTAEDVLSGVSAEEGFEQITNGIAQTLNMSADDDDESEDKNPKK